MSRWMRWLAMARAPEGKAGDHRAAMFGLSAISMLPI